MTVPIPPPPEPPPEILISTVVPLTAKVFPLPTKLRVFTGPDVIVVPAYEIPRLKPPAAVTMPVKLAPPDTFPTILLTSCTFD